jgi:hypothetical protein
MLGRLGLLDGTRKRQEQRDTQEESAQDQLRASVEAYVSKANRRERDKKRTNQKGPLREISSLY